MDNIDKSCVLDPTFEQRSDAGITTDLSAGVDQEFTPSVGMVLFSQCSIFRDIVDVVVLELNPASGLEVSSIFVSIGLSTV